MTQTTMHHEDHDADATRFEGRLQRFQRRLRFDAFVRYLPAPAVVAVVAIEIAVLAARLTVAQTSIWLAGGAALAVGVAGVLALIGTPSLPATARSLDARFRLEDRVVTALEFVGQPDSVSRLIVADALRQLSAHAPNELPLAMPFGRRTWAAAAFVSVFLLCAIGIGRAPRAGQDTASALVAGDASAASQGQRGDSATAARERDAATDRSTGETVSVVRRARQDAPQEDRAPAPSSQSQPQTGSQARADTGGPRATGSAQTAAQPGPATGAAEAGIRPSARSGAGAGPNGTGAAAGGAAAEGRTAGAGGVKGIPVVSRDAGTTRLVDSANDPAKNRAARTRAESALAQERVPAALRSYVRNYLSAIDSGGQP